MLRIVICCLGGASSGFVAFHLREEAKALGLDERATFSFMGFGGLKKRQDDFDIAMICPHQEYEIKAHPDDYHIPVYVIPMVMYGTMPAEYLLEDAEDLVEIWASNPHNPVTFPDEPRSMTSGRTVSHRRAVGEQSQPQAGELASGAPAETPTKVEPVSAQEQSRTADARPEKGLTARVKGWSLRRKARRNDGKSQAEGS